MTMTDTKAKLIALVDNYTDPLSVKDIHKADFAEKLVDFLLASSPIQELWNEAYDLGVDFALHNHFGLSWEDATGLRKEIKQLQDAVRWIPVAERLPQEDLPFGALCEVVQVLLNDGSVTIGWCNRGLRCWFHMPIQQSKMVGHEFENTPVIAWQPLAQPPKED